MITIDKLYTERSNGQARLCAKVRIHEKSTVLWFGVEEKYESILQGVPIPLFWQ